MSRSGGADRSYCNGGPRTQYPGAMTPHWPSNRLNLFPRPPRHYSFPPSWLPCALPNWQWVVLTHHIEEWGVWGGHYCFTVGPTFSKFEAVLPSLDLYFTPPHSFQQVNLLMSEVTGIDWEIPGTYPPPSPRFNHP